MPVETEQSAPGKSPGVSVSAAFGLPEDWTLANSLKGVAGEGEKREAPAAEKELPAAEEAEGAEEKGGTETEKVEGAEATEESSVEADKKEADRIAAEKDKKAADAAAGKKPADKTAAKPGEKAKPDAKAGAKPDAKAGAKPKPDVPPLGTEKKLKVGDKEYTEAELKAALEGKAKPEEKKAEPAKVETAEEKAAREQDTKKQEQTWLEETARNLEAPPVTEKEIDTILMGGKEAVEALQSIRKRDMAHTLLGARKDIFEQLKPVINAVDEMNQRHAQAEDTRMFNEMISGHAELTEYRDLVNQHAHALVEAHPEEVAKMTEKQFNDKVADLTIAYIKRFNPQFGAVAPAEGAESVTTDAPAGGAAKPEAGEKKPAAAGGKGEPAAKKKSPPPPAGNIPGGGTPKAGGKGGDRDFQKSAVESLM